MLFLSSCEKETDNNDLVSKEIKEVNQWILENMEALYLWNDRIPSGLNPANEPDPEEFFDKMLYKEEDKWSSITPDLDALLADLQGTPLSSGISPAFIRIGDNQILLIVEFVFPGSPADRAGLQRGDLILTIDGQYLNLDNYFELFSKSTINVRKGILSGSDFIPSGETISIVSEIIEAEPVIHHEILNINGIKTGYFVYTSFTSGVNDRYIDTLDNIFQEFKSEGISTLIVDLRYNRGGEIDVAGYLASAIAPTTVVNNKETLVRYVYNKDLTDYFNRPGTDPRYLGLTFPSNLNNLNLSKVYFLTGWKSASASELIIIGLQPHMNVVTIGESTYGKYTGSWVLTDTNDPPKHKWAMMPIVLKYANKVGFTDFKNGLTPDHEVVDPLFALRPFGDPGDPLLSKAKELITGVKTAVVLPGLYDIPYSRVEDEETRRKSWLIMKEVN